MQPLDALVLLAAKLFGQIGDGLLQRLLFERVRRHARCLRARTKRLEGVGEQRRNIAREAQLDARATGAHARRPLAAQLANHEG